MTRKNYFTFAQIAVSHAVITAKIPMAIQGRQILIALFCMLMLRLLFPK